MRTFREEGNWQGKDTMSIKDNEKKNHLIKRTTNNRLPDATIDQYLTMMLLERTVGEVAMLRESASNAKQYWTSSLIIDSIIEKDIGLINQIATRVDGTVPTENDRSKFANLIGEAIDDVMAYPDARQCVIQPDDLCVIALAKAVLFISLDHPGKNVSKRRDKQAAVELILGRTGGRKTEPVKELLTTNYVDPDWMGLPEGEKDVEEEN